MDTKFTKGKWVANASEFPFPHGHVFIQGGGFDVSRAPDCVANAHLIAAAPDMYEALRSICNGEGLQPSTTIEGILAKARGEL